MELKVFYAKSKTLITTLHDIEKQTTIDELKDLYHKKFPSIYRSRQSFRSSIKGKSLKDSEIITNVIENEAIYFKDLGPQIGWSTVFYAEYAGPLFAYLFFYSRPYFIYGTDSINISYVSYLAMLCHSFHYIKRLLETKFVHRFSHGTMPIANLFRNCSYYWTFAAWQSYLINHPLYTSPSDIQVKLALIGFIFCQIGNFSIHMLFKNLRKKGTTQRQIPLPNGNPFSSLFNFVSCPNYTYEAGSWVCFTIMTSCFASGVFAALGLYQMSMWAIGKHNNYKREFSNYPRARKAIIPFLI